MSLDFREKHPWFPSLSPAAGWRLVLIFVGVSYYLALALTPSLFRVIGVDHKYGLFIDSRAILAASDAVKAGLDVRHFNPLDNLGRPHAYSNWWLRISGLGLTQKNNFLLGGLFAGAFFAAVTYWLRPRTAKECWFYFAIIASTPVVLAVERANSDLVIFGLLAPMVPMLMSGNIWVRGCAALPVVISSGLKFYPAAAAGLVLAGKNSREVCLRFSVCVLLLAVVFYSVRVDLSSAGIVVPESMGLLTFGSSNWFIFLGASAYNAKICGIIAGGLIYFGSSGWADRQFGEWRAPAELRREWLGFILGALLLVGCFFAVSNFAYRLIYGLLITPFLWRLAHDAGVPQKVAKLARTTLLLLFVCMWVDGLAISLLSFYINILPGETIMAWGDRLAFGREPLMWGLVFCLIYFLKQFGREVTELFGFKRALKARAHQLNADLSI